jgi:KDO2-lipid IV(A) lauroyltransferase
VLKEPGRGVILASGHLGNWEFAARLVSDFKPVVGVAREMNNPYTARLLAPHRVSDRFRTTPKHDPDPGRFLSTLKRGEMLALLVDQHAREHGMPIDFFGMPASTVTSPALLHLVTRAPVVFGYCVRREPGRYLLAAADPVIRPPTGDKEADVRAVLRTLTAHLEDAVRRYPEQYLWAHRRWRVGR